MALPCPISASTLGPTTNSRLAPGNQYKQSLQLHFATAIAQGSLAYL